MHKWELGLRGHRPEFRKYREKKFEIIKVINLVEIFMLKFKSNIDSFILIIIYEYTLYISLSCYRPSTVSKNYNVFELFCPNFYENEYFYK